MLRPGIGGAEHKNRPLGRQAKPAPTRRRAGCGRVESIRPARAHGISPNLPNHVTPADRRESRGPVGTRGFGDRGSGPRIVAALRPGRQWVSSAWRSARRRTPSPLDSVPAAGHEIPAR